MPIFTDDAFAQAAVYLQSYHDVYPIEHPMLIVAVKNRFLGNIYSTWIEEEHYLNDNNRVDLFLLGAVETLQYLAASQQAFAERLWSTIG